MIEETALLHGLVALLVPLGWVMLLYPLYRRDRREWKRTLVFVVVLSFSAMVAKEILMDPEISPDDIAADLLGLFFGTGIASVMMYLEKRFFSTQKTPDEKAAPKAEQNPSIPEQRPPIRPKGTVSLRDVMAAWIRVQERAAAFYEASVRNSGDTALREAWVRLARDKRDHIREARALLAGWPSRTPDVVFLDWMDEQIERHALYAATPAAGLPEKALIDSALANEHNTYHLFFALRECFESQSWKMRQMDQVIRAQERWLGRLGRLAHETAGSSERDTVETEEKRPRTRGE